MSRNLIAEIPRLHKILKIKFADYKHKLPFSIYIAVELKVQSARQTMHARLCVDCPSASGETARTSTTLHCTSTRTSSTAV